MILDVLGLFISEIGGYPGNIGDSAANTSRAEVLNPKGRDLSPFVTDKGFVRYPTAPDAWTDADGVYHSSWRETDFSDDQMLPLYMGGSPEIRAKIKSRNRFMAANGGLHNPITMCIINDLNILTNIPLLLQKYFMMYIPYRWSDADGLKWYQRFEKTSESSADWINWIVTAVYLKRHNRLYIDIPLDVVSQKVLDYFHNEPNNEEVLADFAIGMETLK